MTATMTHELDRLRAEVARLVAERDAALATKAGLERKVSKLEHALEDLLRKLYGRSSEKVVPGQILLEFAAEESKEPLPLPPHAGEAPDGEAPEAKPRKKKSHGWGKVPKDLPRKIIELWPSEDECKCDLCGARRISIGSPEINERYDYKPASIYIVQTIRHRVR